MKILEQLKINSRQTTQQISKKTLIPITTIYNRIKKMEKEGIIKRYTCVFDYKKLGYDVIAFVMVTVTYMTPNGNRISQEALANRIGRMKNVEDTYIVTGGVDIIVKVRVKNMDELNDFVINKLRKIDGVENTQTIIVLSEVETNKLGVI